MFSSRDPQSNNRNHSKDSLSPNRPLKIPCDSVLSLEKISSYFSPRASSREISVVDSIFNIKTENDKKSNENEQKHQKGEREKQRSEKSYEDLNKSIANLGRLSERNLFSATSLVGSQTVKNYSQNHIKSASNSKYLSKAFSSGKLLEHPITSPFLTEVNEEKYQNTKEDHSLQRSKKNLGRKITSLLDQQNLRESNPFKKQLLTEGDSPLAKENNEDETFAKISIEKLPKSSQQKWKMPPSQKHYLLKELSDIKERNRKNPKIENMSFDESNDSLNCTPSFRSNRENMKKNLSPKVQVPSKLKENVSKLKLSQTKEEDYDSNWKFISDGVEYGKGGVGYQSRMNDDEQHEMALRSGRSIERNSKGMVTPKDTVNGLKKDLLEVQKDIAKRRTSYDKVEKFLMMCKTEGSLLPHANFMSIQDESGSGKYSSSLNLQITPFQTHPTTLQTQQTPKGFSSSRAFSASQNLIKNEDVHHERLQTRDSMNIKVFEEIQIYDESNEKQVIIENLVQERSSEGLDELPIHHNRQHIYMSSFVCEHGNCKNCQRSPCCGSNSNCQIF